MTLTRLMSLKRVMSIKEFCDEYAVGTTRFYEEVKGGRIRLSKLGRKSLITRDEAERWLKNLPTSGADGDPWDGDAEDENQLALDRDVEAPHMRVVQVIGLPVGKASLQPLPPGKRTPEEEGRVGRKRQRLVDVGRHLRADLVITYKRTISGRSAASRPHISAPSRGSTAGATSRSR